MKRHGDSDGGELDCSAKSGELSAASPVTDATDARTLISAASTAESRKRVARIAVPFGSLAEAFTYVAFLLLFLLATAVVDRDGEQAFFFASRLRAALVDAPFAMPVTLRSSTGAVVVNSNGGSTAAVQKSFDAIQDQADVWAFLEGPFADVIYGPDRITTTTTPNAELPETSGLALSYNRVLGGVRLRTLRVTPESCPPLSQIPEYASILPDCYADFSRNTEQTRGYGPVLNSADIAASRAFAFAKDAFAAKDAATRTFDDLTLCLSDCERACGDAFGVERYRYGAACAAQCSVHCKCIYEQPAGFDLCADPNPDGAGAPVPTPRFAYNWSSSTAMQLLTITGATGTSYDGSGYVLELAANGTQARATLAQLRADRFIDLATRALAVDVTVYNAHTQLVNVVQVLAEFPTTGGTHVQLADDVLRPFQYAQASAARIALECFVVLYVSWYWYVTLQCVVRARSVVSFVRNNAPWHGITLLFLLASTAAIALRLYVIDQAYGTLSGHASAAVETATLSTTPQFASFVHLSRAESIVDSVVAALVWLKLLQYATVSKRLCLLLRTLQRASPDLLWFAVVVGVCVCGCAQVAYLLFGYRVAQFRTLGTALVTLLQGIGGDLDFSALQQAHRALGPLFYVAYYLLLLLVLLNIFIAILSDAYVQTLAEQDEADAREAADDRVAMLCMSERSLGRSTASDNNPDDLDAGVGYDHAEARLDRRARREMEQLQRYPFSCGVGPALRLLVVDVQRAVYELRTGRRAVASKVDPFVIVAGDGSVRPRSDRDGDGTSGGTSRKWTTSVKKQLEKQLAQHAQQQQSAALEAKDAEMAALRSAVDRDISTRLTTLVESSRAKTQRMADLEHSLGAIERLCQQLLTDTAYLRDDSDDKSKRVQAADTGGSTNIGGAAIQRRGKNALGQQVQRRAPPASALGLGGSSGSPSTTLTGRRPTATFKPQSLSMALSRGSGGSSSKRLVKKGSAGEEIEEITL